MTTVPKSPRSTTIDLAVSSAGPFEVGFRLFGSDGLDVFVNGERSTAWTLTATYASGFTDAATITFDAEVTAPATIVIQGAYKPFRGDSYLSGDPSFASKVNLELARLWASVAEVNRIARSAVRTLTEIDPNDEITPQILLDAIEAGEDAEAAAAAAQAALTNVQAAQVDLTTWYRGAWQTATAYAVSDIVVQAGASYVCLSAHTSGTFSTDAGAGRWGVIAEKGATGAGTGDVVAANNGSDFVDKPTTLSNLGAVSRTPTLIEDWDSPGNVVGFVRSSAGDNQPSGTSTAAFWGYANIVGGFGVAEIRRQGGPEQYVQSYVSGAPQGWIGPMASLDDIDDYMQLRNPYEILQKSIFTSVASVTFTDFASDARFVGYRLILTEVRLLQEGTSVLTAQVSDDNGATWESGATDYEYTVDRPFSTTLTSVGDSAIRLTRAPLNPTDGAGAHFEIDLIHSDRDNRRTFLSWNGMVQDVDNRAMREAGAGSYKTLSVVNGLRVDCSPGNMSGVALLLGLRAP